MVRFAQPIPEKKIPENVPIDEFLVIHQEANRRDAAPLPACVANLLCSLPQESPDNKVDFPDFETLLARAHAMAENRQAIYEHQEILRDFMSRKYALPIRFTNSKRASFAQ